MCCVAKFLCAHSLPWVRKATSPSSSVKPIEATEAEVKTGPIHTEPISEQSFRLFMPHHTLNLALKFPLLILVLLFTVIWGLAGYLNLLLKNDLERLLSAQQFSAVSVIAASIDQETRIRLHTLDETAQAIGRRALISDPNRLGVFLRDHLAVNALFNGGFFALDATGSCLASASDSSGCVGLNLADRDYFSAVRDQHQPWIGIPVIGKRSKRPLVAMGAPINDDTGQTVGVLAGVTYLDTENFIGRIVATYSAQQGSVLIVDPQSKRLVAATEPNRTFQLFPTQGDPTYDRYIASYEGSGIARNAQNIEELSSGRRIPTTGWLAMVTLPTTTAFNPVAIVQNALLNTTLFLSLMVPLLAALMVRIGSPRCGKRLRPCAR